MPQVGTRVQNIVQLFKMLLRYIKGFQNAYISVVSCHKALFFLKNRCCEGWFFEILYILNPGFGLCFKVWDIFVKYFI